MVQPVDTNMLTKKAKPGLASNRCVYAAGTQPNHYYVLIGNGGATNPKQGHIYSVTSNGSNTLTVDTIFDNLTGVVANTHLTLIPDWTPPTIFPANDAGGSITSTTTPPTYKPKLLI